MLGKPVSVLPVVLLLVVLLPEVLPVVLLPKVSLQVVLRPGCSVMQGCLGVLAASLCRCGVGHSCCLATC